MLKLLFVVKHAFPKALILMLALLVQTASATVVTLPCEPAEMTTAEQMADHGHHSSHADNTSPESTSADAMECCEDMNANLCATIGCFAGSGAAIAVPSERQLAQASHLARLRVLEVVNRYLTPPAAIFRPPIA